MKRKFTRFALLFLLTAALCSVTALAAGEKGIYDVKPGNKVEITPVANTNTNVTVDGEEYTLAVDAERLTVVVKNTAASKQYLILVTSGTDVPKEGNIVYIDQAAGNDGDLTFNVYPSSLSKGEYSVWLASSDEGVSAGSPAGTFKYLVSFRLGYVDDDDEITATDAQWTLQIAVGNRTATSNQTSAANVDGDDEITATDAQWILQAAVGNRTL